MLVPANPDEHVASEHTAIAVADALDMQWEAPVEIELNRVPRRERAPRLDRHVGSRVHEEVSRAVPGARRSSIPRAAVRHRKAAPVPGDATTRRRWCDRQPALGGTQGWRFSSHVGRRAECTFMLLPWEPWPKSPGQ